MSSPGQTAGIWKGPELNKVEKLAVARPSVCVLQPGELIIYYELEESEKSSSRGIVEVCPDTHRWEDAFFSLRALSTKKYCCVYVFDKYCAHVTNVADLI